MDWIYKEVKESWISQDLKKKLKMRQASIPKSYISSVLLRNFNTCLGHGGQVSSSFVIPPPSISRYLEVLANRDEKTEARPGVQPRHGELSAGTMPQGLTQERDSQVRHFSF